MKFPLLFVAAAALLAPCAGATDFSHNSRPRDTPWSRSGKAGTFFALPPLAMRLSGVTASACISRSQARKWRGRAGVSPKAALAAGLKVDVDALPRPCCATWRAASQSRRSRGHSGTLKLDAVLGVTGLFDEKGKITSMGIQCAFCHSTVDDSFAPASGAGATAGRTAISTSAPSWHSHRDSSRWPSFSGPTLRR